MTTTLARLLTAYEVADVLGIHFRSVYELRKSGELPAARLAGTWRFDPEDIRSYIEKKKDNGAHA